MKTVFTRRYAVGFACLATALLSPPAFAQNFPAGPISLINPYAPLAPALNQLADPLLSPIRRVLPLVGNFDLSPLVAILVIQVLLAFVHPASFPMLLGG